MQKKKIKDDFRKKLSAFANDLTEYVSDDKNDWKIKGFIDIDKNVFTISSDTKVLSKILELHLFPKLLKFSRENNFELFLADHQNYYPDISFVSTADPRIKFALDIKTTYVLEKRPNYCNGFTLGSHGKYFIDRDSKKNIQFPYREYLGHYCLGIIYNRSVLRKLSEVEIFDIRNLEQVPSVINNFTFFIAEKWEIASDKSGSGNTANIGSIKKIDDIIKGNGTFKKYGEDVFDDYWMNFKKIIIKDKNGKNKKINTINEFLKYRGKIKDSDFNED